MKYSDKKTEDTSQMDVDQDDLVKSDLMEIISRSNSQSLETNIVKRLDSNRNNENDESNEVHLLAESIFKLESQQQNSTYNSLSAAKYIDDSVQNSTQNLKQSVFHRQLSNFNYQKCVVDVLLDLYCRRDPQIVRKKLHRVETEFRLLFEQRKCDGTFLTQSFLLALFIHQANWTNLFECVQYLLDSRSIFSKLNNSYS